jgi:hypothetical protein
MNIRRILISEQEKKDILSQYGVKKNIISEQTLNTDGTYTIKNDQLFTSQGQKYEGNTEVVIVRRGTLVKKNTDGKSVIFNLYYNDKNDSNKLKLAATKGVFSCGGTSIRYKDSLQSYVQKNQTSFQSTMNRLFCDGDKLKSDKEQNTDQQKKEQTTQKKCYTANFTTPTQKCKLPGDNTWMYAKDDLGKWYASRQSDGKKWCELVLSTYKAAVDKLVAGCSTTTEPIKLDDKPAEVPQQTQTKPSQTNIAPDQDNEERPQQ